MEIKVTPQAVLTQKTLDRVNHSFAIDPGQKLDDRLRDLFLQDRTHEHQVAAQQRQLREMARNVGRR
jgi:hypothetical protein